MLGIRGILTNILRKCALLIMNPILRYLGYERVQSKMEIPESHYFVAEDSLGSLNQIHKHYLKDTGWIESKNFNQSIRNGKYIPWTSYAFIHWVEERNFNSKRMLEFGSGASTFYWATRFEDVLSIESDYGWYERVKLASVNLKNVDIEFLLSNKQKALNLPTIKELESVFIEDLSYFPELNFALSDIDVNMIIDEIKKSNCFFVDGGPRNSYMYLISLFAKNDSLIFVDNSDQYYTEPGRRKLEDAGYKEIEFNSLGPLNHSATSTSIYIRNLDILQEY